MRLGLRPCLDVNGIHSGFAGPGSKTIIPSRAEARLTARTAAGQSPRACLAAIERHLAAHAPDGLELSITEQGAAGEGLRIDPDAPVVRHAAAVLKDVVGAEPVLRWEGASIPIVAALARVSGAAPLLVGFGLEADAIHAPNESFSLDQFRLGYAFVYRFLETL